MTLTYEQTAHFANDWNQDQLNAFGQRLASASTQSERVAVLAEFKANLPDPAYDSHPQSVKLQAAARAAAMRLRSGQV
jgi:hypothetical protein